MAETLWVPVDASTEDLITQLEHPRSSRRRFAARRLREASAREAGPALLAALRKEVRDARTWETQYQMVMALGEAGYVQALDFIAELARRTFEATMVYTALGDATVRLREVDGDGAHAAAEITRHADDYHPLFVRGALRALAMLRLVPGPDEIDVILAHGRRLPPGNRMAEGGRLWIAAAAAGWRSEGVRAFLQEVMHDDPQTRRAAISALDGHYLKLSPV